MVKFEGTSSGAMDRATILSLEQNFIVSAQLAFQVAIQRLLLADRVGQGLRPRISCTIGSSTEMVGVLEFGRMASAARH